MYTNLAPGPYVFRVKASNGGAWNDHEAAIRFYVEPAYWQTWWFRLALLFVGAAAVWGVYRLRIRQIARQLDVRFEERLAERTRIAQELHDTLLQGFVSASMQLHVAADRLPAESPVKPSLGRVIDLVGRVIEEGRNAVRGLRSAGSDTYDLEQAFAGIQRELDAETTTSYRVVVEGQPRPLIPLIRDEVYRIGREGVVNAFRHARAPSIEVQVEYGPQQLRLVVRDDGRGIDPALLRARRDGHWGLTGMNERADLIGAHLTVLSRTDRGTEVQLTVPGHVAFLRNTSPSQPGWRAAFVRLWPRARGYRASHGPDRTNSDAMEKDQ